MLTGKELGTAIEAARLAKGVSKKKLAEDFGVKPPSVQGWVNHGRIDKAKLMQLIAYFSDVVPLEHWGLDEQLLRSLSAAGEEPEKIEHGTALVPASDNPKEAAAAAVMEMLQKHRKGLSAAAQQKIADAVADSLAESVPATVQQNNVIIADFLPPAPPGDAIRIAHYDVRTALGGGQLVPDYPEIMPDLLVSRQHLQELGVIYKDPCHLKMLTGYGQSMAPTIQHLDPMIVDVSIREFEGDGIYSFVWQGHFYTKRLQVADAEHFEMISDNPNHKDRLIRIDETYIQARVLLVWNAKKL